MIRHKSFVFKLKPDGATRRSLAKACGCVRFVYNKALDWNKEQQTFQVSYPKLCALLPEWKREFPWLGECHSQVLQQGMKDLMTAMVNFFDAPNFRAFTRSSKMKTQSATRRGSR